MWYNKQYVYTVCVYIYACMFQIYIYVYFFSQHRGPKSNNTTVAMSTPSAQILASKTIKATRSPWRNG